MSTVDVDVAGIEANNAAFVSAVERGDPPAVAACYSADALLLPPGAPAAAGRDAVEAFWRAGIEAGLRAVKLETLSLEAHGDVAFEVGRAIVTLALPTGESVTDVGKYVVVHRRAADRSWTWAIDIFNSDARAPGVAPGVGTA